MSHREEQAKLELSPSRLHRFKGHVGRSGKGDVNRLAFAAADSGGGRASACPRLAPVLEVHQDRPERRQWILQGRWCGARRSLCVDAEIGPPAAATTMKAARLDFDYSMRYPGTRPARPRAKVQPRFDEANRGPRAVVNYQEEAANGDYSFEGVRLLGHAVQEGVHRRCGDVHAADGRVVLALGAPVSQEKSKTKTRQGVFVDSAVLGDDLRRLVSNNHSHEKLFLLSMQSFKNMWYDAKARSGLTEMVKPAHSLRHAGASDDIANVIRSLEMVTRRWRGVQRYTKAWISMLRAQLPRETLDTGAARFLKKAKDRSQRPAHPPARVHAGRPSYVGVGKERGGAVPRVASCVADFATVASCGEFGVRKPPPRFFLP